MLLDRSLPQNTVSLQGGTETISATDLNQVRQQTLQDMMQKDLGTDMKASYVMQQLNRLREDMRTDRVAQSLATMRALTGLDNLTAGRGVSKTNYSPAQNNGYFPQNP